MPAPIKPSQTSPQYAAVLRKIMLVEQLVQTRNDDYKKKLKAHLLEQEEKLKAKLTKDERKSLVESFTRGFYSEETSAIGEFEALKKKHAERVEPLFNSGASLEQYQKERYIISQGLEAHVAQSLFTESAFKSLSEKYPDVAQRLKSDIKQESQKFKGQIPASAAHMPATVALFNKRFPGIRKELEATQKNEVEQGRDAEQKNKMTVAALALLKTGSMIANPSGFLIGQAIGGILKTKAMKPLINGVALGINRVAENSGLKSAFKRHFSSLSGKNRAMIAAGVAAVGVTTLVLTGIIEPDKAADFASRIVDSMQNNIELAGDTIGKGFDYVNEGFADLAQDSPAVDDKVANLVMNPLDSKTAPSSSDYSLVNTEPLDTTPESQSIQNVTADLPPDPSTQTATPGDVVHTLTQVDPTTQTATPGDVVHTLTQVDPSIQTATPEAIAKSLAPTIDSEALPEVTKQMDQPTLPSTLINETTYKIKPGDTLSEIVETRLREAGVPYDYNTIQYHMDLVTEANKELFIDHNNVVNQDRIFAGKTLTLPPLSGTPSLVTAAEMKSALANTVDLSFKPSTDFSALLSQTMISSTDPLQENLITLSTTPIHPSVDGITHINSEALRAELAELAKTTVTFPIVDDTGAVLEMKEGTLGKLGIVTQGLNANMEMTASLNGNEDVISRALSGEPITANEWKGIQLAAVDHQQQTQDMRHVRSGLRR